MKMISNARIYMPNHEFVLGNIEFENGIIADVKKSFNNLYVYDEIIDAKGKYLIPGLIDIHFHGCVGADFSDADIDALEIMAKYEASHGITTICPASMTMSKKELFQIMKVAGNYESREGADFAGINMEGPFISKYNKGAQQAKNIIPSNIELFRELQKVSNNRIKMVDIAPEEEAAMEFIEALKDEVVISIAHTKADYKTAMEAFKTGARHLTHVCNAMPPLNHREPGVIAAAMDAKADVELICDGIHIHPAMIRVIFRIFGPDKICFISDSMRATGLGDGKYSLGGQEVFVKGNLATLKDGTIAGSVTNLMDCLRNAVTNAGISMEDGIRCATENPAKAIGIFKQKGSLEAGKDADFLLIDEKFKLHQVFVSGEKLVLN